MAHIAGLPLEEVLPMLAAPLAVYLAAATTSLRAARRRLGSSPRRHRRSRPVKRPR